MSDEPKLEPKPTEGPSEKPRSESAPAESEVSRGNVFSEEGDEPEIESPPPLPH